MIPECSVVLPAYNEGEGLVPLVEEIVEVMRKGGFTFEIIFVDDGSRDNTWQVIQQCGARFNEVRGVRFSRNFGHQVAVHVGIKASSGEMVAIMDSDGQDPPELLCQMFSLVREGHDVVNCIRQNRKESAFLRFCYYMFYRIYRSLVSFDIPVDSGDFSAINRKTANAIASISQHTPFLRGIRSWTGGVQVDLPYTRHARRGGVTKYSIVRLSLLAINGITAFSKIPLRVSIIMGVIISFLSILYAVSIVIVKLLTGYPEGLGGWASLAFLVSFLGGMHLTVLGIIGEYLGHVFDAVHGLPPFRIVERHGFDAEFFEFEKW